jgi:choline kinase
MEEIAIVAGGMGIRLEDLHRMIPKTLLKIGKTTILDRIVDTMSIVFNNDFKLFIAAGTYFKTLRDYISTRGDAYSKVEVFRAKDWKEGNAATLIALENIISNEEFILQMSDHLFSPETYRRCVRTDKVEAPFVCGEPRLEKLHDYLDLDDATKILAKEDYRILNIGKTIPEWNYIDMGIFRLTEPAFKTIRSLPKNNKSLSGYVNKWNLEHRFFVSPQPRAIWKDIDTPSDFEWAVQLDKQAKWV